MARRAVPAAAIFLLAFAAMAPCLGNGFTNWDDPIYVTENPLIRDFSPGGLFRIFSELGEGIYAPVPFVGLAAQYAAFGLKPFFFHLTSLLLHALNSLCVFWLVRRLSRQTLAAFAAAALFAVHPLHVENVAWVTDQADLWATLFFLAAFIAYAAGGEKAAEKPPPLSLAFFLASILSKSPMFTLPFVLVAYDLFRDGKFRPISVKSKWPFFAMAAAIILVTVKASSELHLAGPLGPREAWERLLSSSDAVTFYLKRAIRPRPLAALYPFSVTGTVHYALSAVLPAVLALAVFLRRRKSPALFFGSLFFMITIFPALPWASARHAPFADRYFYLPSVGLFFAVGAAASAFYYSPRWPALFKRTALTFLALAVGALGYVSAQRCAVWRDSQTLWSDVTRQYPDRVPLAHLNLGSVHFDAGRFDEAMRYFERSIAIDPKFPNGYMNRGGLRFRQGDAEGSLADYAKAIELKPDLAAAYANRAIVLLSLGRYPDALADSDKAIALKPKQAFNYNVRGDVRMGTKAYKDAFADYSVAIAVDPYFAESYNNRGILWGAQGQPKKAAEDFTRAIRLRPQDARAYFNRALAYEASGDRTAAAADFEAVLRIDPTLTQARQKLEALRAKPV